MGAALNRSAGAAYVLVYINAASGRVLLFIFKQLFSLYIFTNEPFSPCPPGAYRQNYIFVFLTILLLNTPVRLAAATLALIAAPSVEYSPLSSIRSK